MRTDRRATDRPTLKDRLCDEWARVHAEAQQMPVIEPTPDEARNGWTAETLTAFHAEQRAAEALKHDRASLYSRVTTRPGHQNKGRYHPHRWRA